MSVRQIDNEAEQGESEYVLAEQRKLRRDAIARAKIQDYGRFDPVRSKAEEHEQRYGDYEAHRKARHKR